jgi:hypothetical protein
VIQSRIYIFVFVHLFIFGSKLKVIATAMKNEKLIKASCSLPKQSEEKLKVDESNFKKRLNIFCVDIKLQEELLKLWW